MDIFASKLMHFIPVAVIAMFVLAICVVGCAISRFVRHGEPALSDATTKRLAAIWISVLIPFFLLIFGSMLLSHFSVWHRFNSIMAQKPNRLVISAEGKTNEISDPAVIGEFFQIVTHSKKVMAHHSHTVSEVKLLFPQTGYIYSLCRDSEYTNEFWFGWSGIAGRGRDRLYAGASLGQLRSDDLEQWVRKYAPAGTPQNPHSSE